MEWPFEERLYREIAAFFSEKTMLHALLIGMDESWERRFRQDFPDDAFETAAWDARRTHVPLPLASDVLMMIMYMETHARRAKGNPVPIPEPGSGTAYNSGPRKSVRRGNPK